MYLITFECCLICKHLGGKKRDTNTTQYAKEKVTDGSKLKSEQKRSAEPEMTLSPSSENALK